MTCRKIYIHTYRHTYIHPYIHAYIHPYIHAYIHTTLCSKTLQTYFIWQKRNVRNWSLQPFSQDYDLSSHTTHVVCVNLIHVFRELRWLRTTDFLKNFFMAGLFIFASNLLRENRRWNIFFHISFWCLTWDTNPGFTSKPTHYLLDHGSYNKISRCGFKLTKKSIWNFILFIHSFF